ncbi:conserved hypothetical protein [Candidatus Roizmanbacteria bacterium]|nr:conserved hypothetical protein [Candidatus Roizmanbacteria bacterium]
MMSTSLYLLAKKIHRLLVLIIAVIGVLMAVTGTLLKYTLISKKLTFIDLGLMRSLHNNLSPYFAVVFLGMLITGLIMYLYLLIPKK